MKGFNKARKRLLLLYKGALSLLKIVFWRGEGRAEGEGDGEKEGGGDQHFSIHNTFLIKNEISCLKKMAGIYNIPLYIHVLFNRFWSFPPKISET